MRKSWLIAFVVVLIGTILFWALLGGKKHPAREALKEREVAKVEEPTASGSRRITPVKAPKKEEAEPESPKKLDPNSQAFFEKVDEVLPRHVYQEVTDKCFQDHLDKDQKMKFT